MENAQRAVVRRRLRHWATAGAIIVAGLAIPAVAMATGGGHSDPQHGPGGYPTSSFQHDDAGRIGLVCVDHAYVPGETTTTTAHGQPDPACRPMTREELHKEKTAPTQEAPASDSQTPTPGGPIYPSTTTTSTGRSK